VTPSRLLSLDDPLAAYCLDKAVMYFGQAVEHDLQASTAQGKRKKPLTEAQRNQKINEVMQRWLGITAPKQYRDPLASQRKW